MYTVEYLYTRNYIPLLPPPYDYKPAIQVMLSREDHSSEILFAVLDSGGQKCLFSYGVGEALGIDILVGEEVRLATMSGSIKGYLHDVEMEVLTYEEAGEEQWSFSTRVAFAERDIPRNILGRDGFFEHAKIGFVEMEQRIYLSVAFLRRNHSPQRHKEHKDEEKKRKSLCPLCLCGRQNFVSTRKVYTQFI